MPSPNLSILIHRKHTTGLTLCGMPVQVRDGLTGQILLRRKTSRGVITCPRCTGTETANG